MSRAAFRGETRDRERVCRGAPGRSRRAFSYDTNISVRNKTSQAVSEICKNALNLGFGVKDPGNQRLGAGTRPTLPYGITDPVSGPFGAMNRPAAVHFRFLSRPCDVREVG